MKALGVLQQDFITALSTQLSEHNPKCRLNTKMHIDICVFSLPSNTTSVKIIRVEQDLNVNANFLDVWHSIMKHQVADVKG